ncbi:MAG TPA: AraC family transcriptional regulator [Pelagibacterium sp.]|uniref:helix-turn-helix domain-containing protein n=1 Tax=uncultured Pelagibacterium sp. TaxID=1159875 RepID=UPI000C55B770|nr:AraC family transcriptional regulator [Pelagibacterium sp.]HCO54505.1 AraC family transcriptional regulator [Pelagibacterium sp.]|tara:strand:+ start:4914 stop:5753 length:840 start_codon:yes stop_codon:yes gene_type:complete
MLPGTQTQFLVEKAVRSIESGIEDGAVDYVRAIAHQLNISHHHLHRTFAAAVGEPPGAYRRRISMHAVALRLQWSHEPIGRIGYAVGYASQAALTRVFERFFGILPGRYRTSYGRERLAVPPVQSGQFIRVDDGVPLLLLAKRYRGHAEHIDSFWDDFLTRFRAVIDRHSRPLRRVGLIYNDWRADPDNRVRYDCCVVVSDVEAMDMRNPPAGLHLVLSREREYAGYRFEAGAYDRRQAYIDVGDNLFYRRSLAVTEDPAIELYDEAGSGKTTLLYAVE